MKSKPSPFLLLFLLALTSRVAAAPDDTPTGHTEFFETSRIKDPETGRVYHTIGRKDGHTTHMYYTGQSWSSDSRSLVVSFGAPKAGAPVRHYLYDSVSGKSKDLGAAARFGGGVVSSRNVYYFMTKTQLVAVDLKSNARTVAFEGQPDLAFNAIPTVSNDGNTIGLMWNLGGAWHIGYFDVPSGQLHSVVTTNFAEPYPMPSHPLINPADPSQMVYCHEGLTQNIPDRIWTVGTAGGKPSVLYRQKPMADGSLGEYIGHESWAHDGQRLYFVKYRTSPLKPTGVGFVTRDGHDSGMINTDHPYWHQTPSPDGKWIVADTKVDSNTTKIVLINLTTHQSTLLCKVASTGENPGHPHPSFSPDSLKVTFTFLGGDGNYVVGFMDISDLAGKALAGVHADTATVAGIQPELHFGGSVGAALN